MKSLSGVSVNQVLCPTMRTERRATEAVLEGSSPLMVTLEDINLTTRDEYGLKDGGLCVALEKYQTLFGLKLGHSISGASKTLSKCLLGKDTSDSSRGSVCCKPFEVFL